MPRVQECRIQAGAATILELLVRRGTLADVQRRPEVSLKNAQARAHRAGCSNFPTPSRASLGGSVEGVGAVGAHG